MSEMSIERGKQIITMNDVTMGMGMGMGMN
jgi:hypothetical protein